MKLYIAGPMAGYYNFNAGAFDRAKESIAEKGHDVVSPVDLDREDGSYDLGGGGAWEVSDAERAWFLRRDFLALLECDGIALLEGWEESRGANMELLVAVAAGLERFRFYESGLLRPASVMPRTDVVNSYLFDVAESGVTTLWN